MKFLFDGLAAIQANEKFFTCDGKKFTACTAWGNSSMAAKRILYKILYKHHHDLDKFPVIHNGADVRNVMSADANLQSEALKQYCNRNGRNWIEKADIDDILGAAMGRAKTPQPVEPVEPVVVQHAAEEEVKIEAKPSHQTDEDKNGAKVDKTVEEWNEFLISCAAKHPDYWSDISLKNTYS